MTMRLLKLIVLLILFISCEEISIIEEDIPYEELYVINGQVVGNTRDVEVTITKSFPIEMNVERGDVEIDSLVVFIIAENQGVWALKSDEDGNYNPIEEVIVDVGATYELYIVFNNEKRIFTSTYVPPTPEVEEILIEDRFITCKVMPAENTVYGCKYHITSLRDGNKFFNETIFYELTNRLENIEQAVSFRTSNLPDEYLSEPDEYSVSVEIFAFDEVYKDYYETRENNKPIENIFSEGGGSVFWNVEGENVIGMFIGYTILSLENIQ